MKRTTASRGMREPPIADREYRLPGCPPPGPWAAPRGDRDELLDALKAGQPVIVSSTMLMRVMLHAGMPCDEYCVGGRYYKAAFFRDQRGQLTEYTAESGPLANVGVVNVPAQ